MDFVAIDFETANPQQAPCAIGLVHVENNEIVKEYYTLINPEQPFHPMNTAVHGITTANVIEAPLFPDVWTTIQPYFNRYPIVAHNAPFDKAVFEKAIQRYGLNMLPVVYYDTLSLCRYNFPNAETFDLASVCRILNIELEDHHNALSDAKAAARLILTMFADKNNAIFPTMLGDRRNSILRESNKKFDYHAFTSHTPEFATTTASIDKIESIIFKNSVFVLTGTIGEYNRIDLETMIQMSGGIVKNTVTRKTNYVVVGLQDISIIKDKEGAKSGKILKAETLRTQGYNIKIINCDNFLAALHKNQNDS